MGVFWGPRVNNSDLFIADDVGACAGKGELARVFAGDSLHQRGDLIYGPVGNVVVEVELWSWSHRLRLVRVRSAIGNQPVGQ